MNTPSPLAFSFEPVFLALAAIAALAYLRASHTQRPSWAQQLAFWTALALLACSLDSPLETVALHYLLLAHMLQNAIVADWVPLLLILGLTTAMRDAITARGGGTFAQITRPRFALPFWLAVWYAVHIPALYDYAVRHAWALTIQHLLLVAAGTALWWPVFGRTHNQLTGPVILVYLGLAFVASPFLALAFIFSTSPFYTFYAHTPRLWGLSATQDQNYAGVIMQAEQTLVLFAAITYTFLRLFDEQPDMTTATKPPVKPPTPTT